MDLLSAKLRSALRDHFGYRDFRPDQERIIRLLLEGRDALAVLPTGAGKSLVYQLAAQLLPGITIVVSPLIALMKDQVESVEEHGLAASAINSAQSAGQRGDEIANLRRDARLLYVTPERLESAEFRASLAGLSVSLLVVDEAHCISEWGPTFRPAYLTLPAAVDVLGRPTLLALTATATPWVRRDIIQRLGLRDPALVVQGVDRPNLFLDVLRVETEAEEARLLRALLGRGEAGSVGGTAAPEPDDDLAPLGDGSGIVYTATTRAAVETARWLRQWGIAADYYHGKRKSADRERVQEAFMAGTLRVIAATNAFGLGVDKADVRFVIHRDVPPSLEAYWQEAGRAGRDGRPARCTLIYRPADLGRAAFLGSGAALTRADVVEAHRGLVAHGARSVGALADATALSRADAALVVELLEQAGVLTRARGRLRLRVPDFDPAAIALDAAAQRRTYERGRLEMMRGYAELPDCRRRYLLEYFGDAYPRPRCDWCDNDRRRGEQSSAAPPPSAVEQPGLFPLHAPVRHATWGDGVVHRVAGETITVFFETVGYKTLRADLVAERGLLVQLAP